MKKNSIPLRLLIDSTSLSTISSIIALFLFLGCTIFMLAPKKAAAQTVIEDNNPYSNLLSNEDRLRNGLGQCDSSCTITFTTASEIFTENGTNTTQNTPCPTVNNLSWTVSGISCSGDLFSTESGNSKTVFNKASGRSGSANFICNNGSWIPSGQTCN